MKYSPSETKHLLSPSTTSSSHADTSIRDAKQKKAPSIRKKITKALKKAGEAWYDEMSSSAESGSKIGESIARKVTGTKDLPDTQISPMQKKLIKTSKAIGEFVAAFKEVYPAVAKVPMNLLKDKNAQANNPASEKPAKRESFLKATGRHFIDHLSHGLDLGEEIGRRVTGVKGGSIRKASAKKELAIRAFQAAGFIASYSFAVSTALIGIPQRMLIPQNKTTNDYINAEDSEYKYTGLARRAKVGLLASDSISSIGDHEPSAYLQVPFQHSEYDEKLTDKLRKEAIDAWDEEVARNSAPSTPTQSTVGATAPLRENEFSFRPSNNSFGHNRVSGVTMPPLLEPSSFKPSHIEVIDEHGGVSYVPNQPRDGENSTVISGTYSPLSDITVSSVSKVSDNTPQKPRSFMK